VLMLPLLLAQYLYLGYIIEWKMGDIVESLGRGAVFLGRGVSILRVISYRNYPV
jgi:hypothetical protein